jgi:hypothetical protein
VARLDGGPAGVAATLRHPPSPRQLKALAAAGLVWKGERLILRKGSEDGEALANLAEELLAQLRSVVQG